MDAANVDLKAFSQNFYKRLTLSNLQPVLDTLVYLKHETQVWFEITNLLIPGENDSDKEIHQMCEWIVENLGPQIPLHFTAFHPDFKMLDHPPTPVHTLVRAREIALSHGIYYIYVGNVHDKANSSTYCQGCGNLLIERDWYQLGSFHINKGQCDNCGSTVPGHFEDQPGQWGARRLPVEIPNC